MKKNSKQITRSDLVDLLGKINDSLDKKLDIREKRIEAKMESSQKMIIKRLDHMETGQKNIIHRLDRMEKRNGHARNQLKKAGKNLIEV